MEFKFIGNPNDANDNKGVVSFHGLVFPLNVPVKVDNPATIKKLMGNGHFAICGADGKTHVHVQRLIAPDEPVLVVSGAVAKSKRGRKPANANV